MWHVYLRPYCVVHRSKMENSYTIIDGFHYKYFYESSYGPYDMVHNLNMIFNI